jgi:hypothetical protein
MSNEAANTWIAPYFAHLPFNPTAYHPLVMVLNLGQQPAKVTVSFFQSSGLKAAQKTSVVEPATTVQFAPEEEQEIVGWVRVDSDKPVFPAGQCGALGTYDVRTLPMTFYRAEGVEPHERVLVDAQLVKRLGPSDTRSAEAGSPRSRRRK